jgi:hypothetical protein
MGSPSPGLGQEFLFNFQEQAKGTAYVSTVDNFIALFEDNRQNPFEQNI